MNGWLPGQITLVDLGDVLLGQFSGKAHEYALEKLTEAGAEVRLGVGVTAVHPDGVQVDDGSAISTRTVVRGGGESAPAIAQVEIPHYDQRGWGDDRRLPSLSLTDSQQMTM